MNPNIKTTNVRFNLDKPDQRRAWEYLQSIDKQTFRSYSHVICLALLDYFSRYYRSQEDPYFETREREERFVQQIIDAVTESLQKTLPLFLAGCLTGASAIPMAHQTDDTRTGGNDPDPDATTTPEDGPDIPLSASIDWDFLGA